MYATIHFFNVICMYSTNTITSYSTLYSQKQNWLTLVFCLAENLLKMRKVTWIEYHILLLHYYYHHHLFDYSLRDSQQLLSRLSLNFVSLLEKKGFYIYLHSIPESVETDHPTTRFWKKPGPRRRPLESFSSFVFHPSTYRTVEIVLKEDLTRNYCILRSSTTTIAVYSSSSWFFSVLLRTSVPNIESNSQLNWQVHEGGRSALLPSCTLQAKLALQQKGKNSFLQFPLFTTV